MEVKIFELRDRDTFISCLAIRMASEVPAEAKFLRREGYPPEGTEVMLTALGGEKAASADPHYWPGRTWPTAHNYIRQHFTTLRSGDVVDVEFILGETSSPKASEL